MSNGGVKLSACRTPVRTVPSSSRIQTSAGSPWVTCTQNPVSVPDRATIEADFWIGDLQLGYRLPKRWGSVVLNAFNVNNEKFEYYLSSLEENVVPARTVTLGVNFTSP